MNFHALRRTWPVRLGSFEACEARTCAVCVRRAALRVATPGAITTRPGTFACCPAPYWLVYR